MKPDLRAKILENEKSGAQVRLRLSEAEKWAFEIKSANMALRKTMTALKTLLFTVILPGAATVYIPYWLLSSPSAPAPMPIGGFRYIGWLPILLGAAIYFRCAWDFTYAGKGPPAPIDPPKEVVVRGLYRYVRNPMYAGILTLLFGEALFFASRQLFVYAGAIFLLFHLFVIFYEEPALRQKFGESYRRYCETVPRWMPRWKKTAAFLA
jgi:protein-S-isoprenylcysteine O-methyltransferase Ste14